MQPPAATLSDLPTELVLEIASHLDPLVEDDIRGVAGLWASGLISSADFEYYLAAWGFSWSWMPGWTDHILARFLTDAGAGFDFFLARTLDDAVRAGKLVLLDAIVSRGQIEPTVDHIIIAAEHGNNDTIDHLVERYGVDASSWTLNQSWCPLFAACMHGRAETVRHLIEVHQVDNWRHRTSSGYTALRLAGRSREVTELLEAVLDPSTLQ